MCDLFVQLGVRSHQKIACTILAKAVGIASKQSGGVDYWVRRYSERWWCAGGLPHYMGARRTGSAV